MANLTDDVLKWTLDINGQPAMKELNQLEQSTKDLERTNKDLRVELQKMEAAGKKNTDEYKRLQNQMKGNKATIEQNKNQMDKLRKEVGLNALTAKQLRQEYRRLKTQMDNTTPGTAEWKRLEKQLGDVKNRMGQVSVASKKTNQVMGALKGMLPVLGFAAIAAGAKQLLSNIIAVRQQFEKYEAVLRVSLGSQKAATRELNMLKQFAAETPFALAELTGAYVKLTNYGLKPTREELTKYGDVAASVGKSFDQYVEAIADAVTFEFERLKEFGIKAKKEGDKISFTFKEQTTVVEANSQAIKAYMAGLGELEGVQGSMAAISATLGGRISNLGDAWDTLLDSMGGKTSGVFITVINWMTTFINQLTLALRTVEDLRAEVMQNMETQSMQNALQEINTISASLIRNGVDVQTAQKRAAELYNQQMQNSIIAAKEQLKTAEGDQKESLQTRIDLLTQEMEAVKTHYEQMDAQALIRQKKEEERQKAANLKADTKKNDIYSSLQGSSGGQYNMNSDEAMLQQFRPSDEELPDFDPMATMDELFAQQQLKLDEQRAAGLLSEQEHNILLEDLEHAHLLTMLEMREQLGMDTFEIEKELAQKQIEEQKRVEQEKIASQQRVFDNLARFQHLAGNLVNSLMEAELANAGENEEKKKQIRKKYAVAQFAISAGQIVTDTAVSIMKAFADLGPVGGLIASALLGATGAAQLAIAYGEMNKVRNLWTGGFTDSGEWNKPQGIVHSNEFVANRFATQNPTVRPVLDMIDYAQRSGNISNLNLPAAMAAAPGTKEIVRENNTTVDPASVQIMAELRDELKKGIRSYVVANQDYARAHTEYMDKYNKRIEQRS